MKIQYLTIGGISLGTMFVVTGAVLDSTFLGVIGVSVTAVVGILFLFFFDREAEGEQ